jgi:hypothetical protein
MHVVQEQRLHSWLHGGNVIRGLESLLVDLLAPGQNDWASDDPHEIVLCLLLSPQTPALASVILISDILSAVGT